MSRLQDTMVYCKIDINQNNEREVEQLLNAADEYLAKAGAVIKEGALYELAAKMLVSHWYDNRALIGTVGGEMAYSVKHILLQLKYPKQTEDEDDA